jgi:soluble cytochrome b562
MASVASFANTPAATTAPAHADDIAKFQQSFADAAPANQIQTEQVTPVTHELTAGFRAVLNQFDSLNGHAGKIGKMAEAMRSSGRDLAPSQIIDMTMQCQQMVFQAELTSNVANRSSDGVQQLFRQQS